MEKMDLEALFAEIQTQLLVNNLAPYKPPDNLSPDEIESSFWALGKAQSTHGKKVRENKFRFIEKKEDTTSEETLKQIRESFDHYDANKNGVLNKVEFNAACMEMGIALKSQEDKDKLFNEVGGGGEVSFENYAKWMESRVKVTMDNAESAKAAFKAIADGQATISEAQLKTNPLTDEDRAYLMENMEGSDGKFDYNGFIDKIMLGGSGMTSGGGGGGGGDNCSSCGKPHGGQKFCVECGAKQ
jgi:Ca2+-binding EF-hand superfamily protein